MKSILNKKLRGKPEPEFIILNEYFYRGNKKFEKEFVYYSINLKKERYVLVFISGRVIIYWVSLQCFRIPTENV